MSGVITTLPKFQFSNALGIPMSGGTLTSYLAGTTTLEATYQDEALTTANTNPISLDSRGECMLWLDSTKTYKFVLKNAVGVIQWTVDNITGAGALADRLRTDLAASPGASLIGYLPAGTGAVATTVDDKLDELVSVKNFGPVGDGVADDTTALQNALNAAVGKTLHITKPSVRYLSGPLNVPSNSNIVFDSGVEIRAVSTLGANDRLINIEDKQDITIHGNGSVISMVRTDYTSGEQRHAVNIRGSSRVAIRDLNGNDSGGDGFYVGSSLTGGNNYCKDILLANCHADNNRRQGLSVVSVENFLAIGCSFTNTDGTAPEAGVDIEPNSSAERLINVRFVGCSASGNGGSGFEVMLKDMTSASAPVDVQFIGCVADTNVNGFEAKYGQAGALGQVLFKDCRSKLNKLAGFWDLGFASGGIERVYENCTSIDDNTNGSADNFYTSFYLSDISTELRTTIGNARYVNCIAVDTDADGDMRRGFASRKTSTDAIDSVKYVNCKATGWTLTQFYNAPEATNISVINDEQNQIDYTATTSVIPEYYGYLYTNTGAAGSVTFNLPTSPKVGAVFEFAIRTAQTVNVRAAVGTQILALTTGTGRALQANTIGNSVKVRAISATQWQVLNVVGTWTDIA